MEVEWEKHFSFFLTNFIGSCLQEKKIKLGIYFMDSCHFIYGMLVKKWRLHFLIIALMVGSTGLESIERYVFSNPLMIEALTLTQAWVRRWSILTLRLPCISLLSNCGSVALSCAAA